MPIAKSLKFVAGIMRDFFHAHLAEEEDNEEGGVLLDAMANANRINAQMDDHSHDATATDTTMSDDTVQSDDDEAMPELLPVEADEHDYTPISQSDGLPGGWGLATRDRAAESEWGHRNRVRAARNSCTAFSSIDVSKIETIDLTGGEAPLNTTRMVYQSYDDDDVDTVLTAVKNDADQVMYAVEEVTEKAANEVERDSDEVMDAATRAVGVVRMQQAAAGPAMDDSSDGDSDIEIFQQRKALLRSSMAKSDSQSANSGKAADAANAFSNKIGPRHANRSETTAHSADSTNTSKLHASFASRLDLDKPIHVPQVIGKSAYLDPSLMDPFLASPSLTALLEEGNYPPNVLWASFLKRNIITLDQSSACDNLLLWLDAHPSRYRNITRIHVLDVLSHTRVGRQKAGARKWSLFRPFKLLAKCPNLEHVTMSFCITHLAGFSEWYPDVPKTVQAFNKRYRLHQIMACVPKSLKSLTVDIDVPGDMVGRVRRQVGMWQRELTDYFVESARYVGWSEAEVEALIIEVEFQTDCD
jgi:hypothetical protein